MSLLSYGNRIWHCGGITAVVVVEQEHGGIWSELGWERWGRNGGGVFGHCEILERMRERVGRGEGLDG